MKFFVVFAFLFSTLAYAAADLGPELKLAVKEGDLDLSVRYSPQKAYVELSYLSRLKDDQLENIPTMIKGYFFDTLTGEPLTHAFDYWQGALLNGYFYTDEVSDGVELMKNFSHFGVAFAEEMETGKLKPLYWIKIGELCEQHKKLFWNIDENRMGCPN